ncbi:MAG TPA: FAD-dependent oxidoreductase [Acidimicrobiia bacterium]|jgi:thioredoxin reductase (NADPH)|nr:FAD-dependent oxidoreductase [Acidimicrobiia bacterium]
MTQDAGTTVTLIGHRWARHSHALKDFLGGNRVAYRWLDVDRAHAAGVLLEQLNMGSAALPVAVLADGVALADPSVEQLAEALGMHAHTSERAYDLAIVGGGPAGLAAAVYGGSEGLSTVLIERHATGGQAGTSSRIENYLGFPEGISGADLADRATVQAEKFDVEIVAPQTVDRLDLDGAYKVLHLGDGSSITARSLIIATGLSYKHLHTPGLERLAGAGVYYGAATTEARAAEGEHVYVVGSANSAGQGAMYFSRFAARVTIIFRGAELNEHMSQYLVDQISARPNIDLMPESHVIEALGDRHLTAVRTEQVETGQVSEHATEFLFVFVGAEPRIDWLCGHVAVDAHGYVLCGPDVLSAEASWPLQRQPFHLETSVPGIFAAGDARHGSIRRVAGAVGEGSTAVQLVHRYLAEHP